MKVLKCPQEKSTNCKWLLNDIRGGGRQTFQTAVQLKVNSLKASRENTARVFHSWWQRSVVRTSVFGWQTFPDMCPIYGLQVITLWANCPLWVSLLGQLSLLSLQGR